MRSWETAWEEAAEGEVRAQGRGTSLHCERQRIGSVVSQRKAEQPIGGVERGKLSRAT